MRLAREAHGESDLAERQAGAEHRFGAADALRDDEVVRRVFDRGLEEAREGVRAHRELARERLHREIGAEVRVDVFERAAQLPRRKPCGARRGPAAARRISTAGARAARGTGLRRTAVRSRSRSALRCACTPRAARAPDRARRATCRSETGPHRREGIRRPSRLDLDREHFARRAIPPRVVHAEAEREQVDLSRREGEVEDRVARADPRAPVRAQPHQQQRVRVVAMRDLALAHVRMDLERQPLPRVDGHRRKGLAVEADQWPVLDEGNVRGHGSGRSRNG